MAVFVSYSHADEMVARQLSEVFAAAGIQTFHPEALPVGSSWVSGIEDAIGTAEAFVILVSGAYLESEFSRLELAAALADSTDSAKPIIPVLVDPKLRDSDVPTLLARYQWLDLRRPTGRQDALHRLAIELRQPRAPSPPQDEVLTREEEALRLQMEMLEVERAALEQERRLHTLSLWRGWLAGVIGVSSAVGVVLAVLPASNLGSALSAGLGGAIGIVGGSLFARGTQKRNESPRVARKNRPRI